MRRLGVCALVTFLIVTAIPVLAQNTASVADAPGCLGVPVDTCVRWLGARMSLDHGFLPAAMARRHSVDVNGRPLGNDGITVMGRLPGRVERTMILLKLRPDDTVASAEASLLSNLVAARTEADYDRSGLWDVVQLLLGRRCAGIAKLELYRFFENSLKPRIATQRQDLSAGLFGLHRLTAQSAAVPFCGASFSYRQHAEWRGSAEAPGSNNVVGHAAITVQ